MRCSVVLAALALFALGAAPAAAQAPPEACGQDARSADYGTLRAGTIVVPQRHRYVDGDPNWDVRMARFLGRAARVTRRSGVDERGCPGVRVDVDGGRFFWRVRDLSVDIARPRRVETGPRPELALEAASPGGVASEHGRLPVPERPLSEQADPRVPQACGLTDRTAVYGPVAVGSEVVLGRHRAVDGETNWTPDMDRYVGRLAHVIELAGVDEQGCPLVRVDRDEGEWYWRLRDVQLP